MAIHKHLLKIKQYDQYTYLHSCRVAINSECIGRCIGITYEELRKLHTASKLHDLGKLKVPKKILHKPGKLNISEWEILKKHPGSGLELLEAEQVALDTLAGILTHHECYDGSGYPLGLTGSNIPLFGRIICIADSIDAMLSYRSYRTPTDLKAVAKEIRDCAGSQFDPEIVKHIEWENVRAIMRGYRAVL